MDVNANAQPAAQPDATPPVIDQQQVPPASVASVAQAPPQNQPHMTPPTAQPVFPHRDALAGVMAAIAGPDITHKVDPATGQMTTIRTPPTPGSAFRRILAGALTGMGAGSAAASEGHPGAGILGGIGAGATAVTNRQQALNQQDIENQQKQFQQQQEATKNQQAAKLQEATIALHNMEMLAQRRNMEHIDTEDFEKVQKSNQTFLDKVISKEGQTFPIVMGGEDINGKPGNHREMMAYFSNPDNVKPPGGYHFVYNTTYDTSGLHREGNQWVDRDGKQVDLNDRAAEMVALEPDAKLNETHEITRKEYKDIYGYDPPASMGDKINVTQADMVAGHTKNVAGQNAHDRVVVMSQRGAGEGDKRNDRSYQFNSTQLEKVALPVDQRSQRLSTLVDTLNQNSPQADALIAPELLTTIAGGQGSGVRMSEPEISRIVGGANQWQQLKSKVLAWQADPSKPFQLLPEQRGQVRALITAVQNKIQQKAAALQDARQQLVDAESPTEHRQIMSDLHKKLDDIDSGKGGGGGAQPQFSHMSASGDYGWDGKQWVKVTKQPGQATQ